MGTVRAKPNYHLSMDAKKELDRIRRKLDPLMEEYLRERIEDARRRDTFTAEGLSRIKEMVLSGGKRLRPALMYWGYRAGGGGREAAILRACISVELTHAFLLIHDDIMDRDDRRHGRPTLHEYYRRRLKRFLPAEEAVHAGNSLALVFGDITAALANHILFTSDFPKERIFAALAYLQEVIALTSIGQLKDALAEYRGRADLKEILRTYEYKTARYTIQSPLTLGLILSGAKQENIDALSEAAIDLGVAFQIRDDMLGIFAKADELGKPVGSDIREGKITILVALARRRASAAARARINALLGKKDLTFAEVREFRRLLTDSGAPAEAEAMAAEMIVRAKKKIGATSLGGQAKEFLLSLADYMTGRKF